MLARRLLVNSPAKEIRASKLSKCFLPMISNWPSTPQAVLSPSLSLMRVQMTDGRATELRQLEEADRHIAETLERVARLSKLLVQIERAGGDAQLAHAVRTAILKSLETLKKMTLSGAIPG